MKVIDTDAPSQLIDLYNERQNRNNLAHKWEKPYSQTCEGMLGFAIKGIWVFFKRRSWVKWRSGLGFDDGGTSLLYQRYFDHRIIIIKVGFPAMINLGLMIYDVMLSQDEGA